MTPPIAASPFSVTIILPAIDETWSLRETLTRIESTNRKEVMEQRRPFLGGAVRDGFDAARGTHVVMMSSDLETDPATVPLLIEEARKRPAAIITGTRWKSGAGFEGYDPIKLVLNKIFQAFFALLYRVRLSDLTFAYRIFPTELVRSIRWEDPFLFETIVKPLRLGVEVVEVPSTWRVRTEGVSHNTFFTNFFYFRIGLKTLFTPPSKILTGTK